MYSPENKKKVACLGSMLYLNPIKNSSDFLGEDSCSFSGEKNTSLRFRYEKLTPPWCKKNTKFSGRYSKDV